MSGTTISGTAALHIMAQVGITSIREHADHDEITLHREAVIRHYHKGARCYWQLDPTNYRKGETDGTAPVLRGNEG